MGGQPTTPGPIVTTVTVGSPGLPADGPGDLPRTGLPKGIAVLGLLLLGSVAVLRRRTA